MQTAATIAVMLLGVVGVFQVALALGAPFGQAAWGGGNPGVLPTRMRWASGLVGLIVYPLFILFVLASARMIEAGWLPGTGSVAMWILTAFFALGTVANLASPSRPERVWGPVSLVLAICCAIIATEI